MIASNSCVGKEGSSLTNWLPLKRTDTGCKRQEITAAGTGRGRLCDLAVHSMLDLTRLMVTDEVLPHGAYSSDLMYRYGEFRGSLLCLAKGKKKKSILDGV